MEEAITGQCLHGSHISVRLCSVSMKLGLWMQYWRMAFIIRNAYKGSTSNYPKFNDLSWGTDLTEGMRWYSWQLCRRWGKRPALPILQTLTSNMEEMPLSNHLAGTCHEHTPQHPLNVTQGPVRSLSCSKDLSLSLMTSVWSLEHKWQKERTNSNMLTCGLHTWLGTHICNNRN